MRPSLRRARTVALALAVAAAAVGGLLLLPPLVGAAGNPSLTADPSSRLSDGQFVKVSFNGFAPSSGVAFRQCIATPTNVATDCTVVNNIIGVTNSSGSGTTYLPVYAGSDPSLKNSGGAGSIGCDSAHACVIAGIPPPGSDLTKAALAPITFAPSPDACPARGPNAVLGAGSASAYRAIYTWESTVCKPPASLSVGYTVSNSPDGISNFQNALTDFAVTGPAAGPAPPPKGPTFMFAPLTASAVVVAYRMYDLNQTQITNLTLTPDLVAQIFMGQIPNFARNPAITALNPGVRFPGREVPFYRAEHSAQSLGFTSWLAASAPSWTGGAQEIFPPPAVGATGVTGSTAMGLAVVDPTTDFSNQGNLGFMDSSTAAFYGLPTVQIRRGDGSNTVATPDTISKAINAATVNSDGTITPNYATADPAAYPLPMPTYMEAPTNTISPEKGTVVAGFLKYAVQSGQTTLPPGYSPLPQKLIDVSLQVAAQIPQIAPSQNGPGAGSSPSGFAGSAGGPPLGGLPGLPTSVVAGTSASTCAASPSPDAPGSSPSATPSPSAAPNPTPAASASPSPSASATSCAAAAAPAGPGSSGLTALVFSTGAGYILPLVAALGALSLLIGIGIQAVERFWRPGAGAARST